LKDSFNNGREEGKPLQKHGKLALLGGDNRQRYMAKALEGSGWEVSVWGIDAPEAMLNWEDTICGANAIVLPLPASDDGVRIRSQADNSPRFTTLLERLNPEKCVILGGKIPEAWSAMASRQGFEIHDYFDRETLQMKNALPTVEGAICIAMTELPVTLCGTEATVIGYGRIASLLAERLLALGSKVTVYARKPRDIAHAQIRGLNARLLTGEGETSTLCDVPPDCRVIFNTVPMRIFSEKTLEALPAGCLLIELASFPGAFDFQAAKNAGMKPILASALPGRLFPESAGKILAETVAEILLSSLNTP
jgi:dipicolinate synthase subunit A